MLARNIPLLLNTELVEVLREKNEVSGARFQRLGQPITIKARRGVIMATGGFEHNQTMRDQYIPAQTRTEWSMAPGTNTGDGIRAAAAIGASTELLDQANWWPTTLLPNGTTNSLLTHFMFRNPHSICVNRWAERFVAATSPAA